MRSRTAAFDTLPNSATATNVLRRLVSIVRFYASRAWNPSTIMHWTRVHLSGRFCVSETCNTGSRASVACVPPRDAHKDPLPLRTVTSSQWLPWEDHHGQRPRLQDLDDQGEHALSTRPFPSHNPRPCQCFRSINAHRNGWRGPCMDGDEERTFPGRIPCLPRRNDR